MAEIKQKSGNNGQDITITLASLANAAARQSSVIDNTGNNFIDVLVSLIIKAPASSTSATGYVNVYVFGSNDGGTNYSENAGASDAAITLVSPTNLRLLGQINIVANGVTYKSSLMSVAAAFGGTMPDKWGIVVQNNTGGTLDTTESNHIKKYQGFTSQVV